MKKIFHKIRGLFAAPAWSAGLSKEDVRLINKVRRSGMTYLSKPKLASLIRTCRGMEEGAVEGVFLEAGCALGGSSIVIAGHKNKERPFFVYDVFGMIPPPGEKDPEDVHERYRTISTGKSKGLRGDQYYGYKENLYETVRSNLAGAGLGVEENRISLIKGLVQETMRLEQAVAFAHIDVDWYDPVMDCLKKIYPHLSAGGSIVLDDYNDWGGCRRAVDEYLETIPEDFILDESAGSLKITKKKTGVQG